MGPYDPRPCVPAGCSQFPASPLLGAPHPTHTQAFISQAPRTSACCLSNNHWGRQQGKALELISEFTRLTHCRGRGCGQ